MYKKRFFLYLLGCLPALLLANVVPASSDPYPSLVVPGKQVGPISRDTSLVDLRRIFGPENVKEAAVELGEGMTCDGHSILENSKTHALKVTWDKSRKIAEIHIVGTLWRTADGVGIGSALLDLEKQNGRAFSLAGFGWDYSGTFLGWNEGKLEKSWPRPGYVLRLTPKAPLPASSKLMGDKTFRSNDPEMRKFNPVVEEFIVRPSQAGRCSAKFRG